MAASYKIHIPPTADKSLRHAPLLLQRRVNARIDALAADPRGAGVTRLRNRVGYHLRVGSWRVLFAVDDAARTVEITVFGPRRDIYRI